MDTSTSSTSKDQTGIIADQMSKIRSLEDTLNTIRSLAISVQDSKCMDGGHDRFMRTLMETLGIAAEASTRNVDKAQCRSRSNPDEEEEDGPKTKRFAKETENEPNDDSVQKHVLDWTVEEKVMSNPLIATKIFKLLPTEDLVRFRAVNSIWNVNASRVLREHKKCLAHFYLANTDRKCREFNKLVENSTVLPFTGFSFKTTNPNMKKDDVPNEYFPLKHIEVDLRHIPDPDQPNTIQVLQQTFINCAPDLEVLILTSLPSQVTRLEQIFTQQHQQQQHQQQQQQPLHNFLPKLSKLILPKRTNIIQPKILKDVLKAAPNLAELQGEIVPRQVKPFVVLKKTHLVKTFKFLCKDVMDFHLTSKFARTRPRLNKLIFPKCLSTATVDAVLLYRNVFKMLCDCSQESLEHLEVPHLTFLKFPGAGAAAAAAAAREPVMKSLRRLTLRYDINCGRTLNQLALTRITFAQNFPALNFVILQLDNNLYRGSADNYFGPEFGRQPSQVNQCFTVKKLKVKGKQANSTLMYHMAIIFPNVAELHLSKTRNYAEVFGSLWFAWPSIRSIRCDIRDAHLTDNLDSKFTGLSKSKCEELLATKNFTQPNLAREDSILRLRKLRKLQLELIRSSAATAAIAAKENGDRMENNNLEPFFTDVTVKYAFDLLPKLKVKTTFSVSDTTD